MSVEVALDTPLSHALNSAIPPKLIEVGWSTGSDDDIALSEYIILMLVNGKTQDQIATELSSELLNLGPDDPNARDFSKWLFDQVTLLNTQLSQGDEYAAEAGGAQSATAQDDEMNDVSEAGDTNLPTGPKSMRNGSIPRGPRNANPRDKRMMDHLTKAMDRSNEQVLHRVRQQSGNERINSHRTPPTGPRQNNIRGAARGLNSRANGGSTPYNSAAANIMNMNPQKQQEAFAILSAQVQQMQSMLYGVVPPMGTPMNNNFPQFPQQGKSLLERTQPPPRRNGARNNSQVPHVDQQMEEGSSMDVDMAQEKPALSPDTPCRYNLACTNKDCIFAHQSPEAPPGTSIDVNDVCSFGAACKNRKCVGRHPSPAQKVAHQTESDCKFYPNCTNPRCPFRHPSMPPCRNGADCVVPDCKFVHVKTMCKFNPCLNAACVFKHAEGQKRGKFEDKVWVADSVKQHVSERKFGEENGAEELIVPDGARIAAGSEASSGTAEVIT